uniref:DNA-processing protein DprA n=1 Tax=Polaribacter sp. TaxID=1920175 RepID=UPI004048C266
MPNCYALKKEKLLAALRLQRTKSVGPILAKKLIRATGDVEQIFREKTKNLAKIEGINLKILEHLCDSELETLALQELEYLEKNAIEALYFLDSDYPKNLSHCIDGPILFFKEGKINFNSQRIISIVGTRQMTSYGRRLCTEFVDGLAEYDPTIVSGFAYGVDICAHTSAIENKLQTIAVLAHGFEQIYPKVHKKYVNQVKENGGFITEFWHQEDPKREHFIQRNRIVAGISQATLVIESSEKGGSLITADLANSYNRDVFAIPGRTSDLFSSGCNELIKNHKAALVTSPADIAKLLNWDQPLKTKPAIQKQLFVSLEPLEQKVYDYLLNEGKQLLDVIAIECDLRLPLLASLLFQLEMKGLVQPLPGKLFEAV